MTLPLYPFCVLGLLSPGDTRFMPLCGFSILPCLSTFGLNSFFIFSLWWSHCLLEKFATFCSFLASLMANSTRRSGVSLANGPPKWQLKSM